MYSRNRWDFFQRFLFFLKTNIKFLLTFRTKTPDDEERLYFQVLIALRSCDCETACVHSWLDPDFSPQPSPITQQSKCTMVDASSNGLDSSASDSDLARYLNAAKDGSLSGLGQLLDSFRPALMEIADQKVGQRLRRRMSLSDLVQDTMLTAGKQFASFDGNTSSEFRQWLRELFHSRLVDGLRRHQVAEKRRQDLEDEKASVNEIADQAPSASRVAALQEDADLLLHSLQQLTVDSQKIIHLRYLQNRTFEEISTELNMPLSTVWHRFHEAVVALQLLMQREF